MRNTGSGLMLLERERAVVAGYNADFPPEFQDVDWTCSAATLAWMLSSIGRATSESQAIDLLRGRIDARLGLLEGNGLGLVEVINRLGLSARPIGLTAGGPLNGGDPRPVTFDEVAALAGSGPIGMGGGNWYHWTGVRRYETNLLHLANPAPGYKLVYQTLDRLQFKRLGPFHAIIIEP